MKRAPKLPNPTTAEDWTAEARRLRRHLLPTTSSAMAGPASGSLSPARLEDLGLIPSGKGYRLRRLRFEIVPGFQLTAILYEPERLVVASLPS